MSTLGTTNGQHDERARTLWSLTGVVVSVCAVILTGSWVLLTYLSHLVSRASMMTGGAAVIVLVTLVSTPFMGPFTPWQETIFKVVVAVGHMSVLWFALSLLY